MQRSQAISPLTSIVLLSQLKSLLIWSHSFQQVILYHGRFLLKVENSAGGTVVHPLFWHSSEPRPRSTLVLTAIYLKLFSSLNLKSLPFLSFLEHAHNFQKYPRDLGSSFGKPYDYHSVMHYSKYAFAKHRDIPTIVPKEKKALIGQRFGLSLQDREEINKLYRCKG